jgi:hypothetical protein
MKKLALLLLLAWAVALSGCSHQYVMTLSNRSKIVTASKPKLENGFYVYKDARGDKHSVSQARVIEIAPASMTGDESSKFRNK